MIGFRVVFIAAMMAVALPHPRDPAGVPVTMLAASDDARVSRPAPDPLPSWNDGPAKRAILEFVERVTRAGGADFVPVADRIAVFDNDGTLWQEQPVVEGVFTLQRVKARVAREPSLAQREPFKALVERDREYFTTHGERAIAELFVAANGGMTQETYAAEARAFVDTARHPKLGARYVDLTYQPMRELLAHLRANGFQTWLCSGGTSDFMRTFAMTAYEIPPERVIGSEFRRQARMDGGKLVIWRLDTLETLNDKEAKPVNIDRQLGRRPLLVGGNVRSGGDIAQMQYSKGRTGPSLQLLVDHDDAQREFAYAERDSASLTAARRYGFTVVSMKRDWKTVFGSTADRR